MKTRSTRICALASSMLIGCCAFAQDITVGSQPDLVIGAQKTPKAAPAPATALSTPVVTTVQVAPAPGRGWNVETKDVTLANTFQRWAAVAGWRVRWDAAQNVMVDAPDTFNGTFEDAVAAQLASPGIAYSAYPLEVCFYPNTPPLARVTRKGDQLKECK